MRVYQFRHLGRCRVGRFTGGGVKCQRGVMQNSVRALVLVRTRSEKLFQQAISQRCERARRMSKLVTIFGGSGFVGRYIARRMAKEGWRVRVAVRRPNEALFVRPYGVVGSGRAGFLQHPRRCLGPRGDAGADAVVNCVGILSGKRQEHTLTPCRRKAPAGSPGLRPRRVSASWSRSPRSGQMRRRQRLFSHQG